MGRQTWAVLAAIAAHAVFLRAASRLPAANRLLDGRAAIELVEVEIEDASTRALDRASSEPEPREHDTAERDAAEHDTDTPATPSDADPTSASPRAPRAETPDVAVAASRTPDVSDRGVSAGSPSIGSATESAPAPAERGGAIPAPGSAGEYGDADAPPTAGPSGPLWAVLPGLIDTHADAAPTETPRSKEVGSEAATKVLAATLRSRDAAVGIDLPATQVVVGAVSQAVRSSGAPHNTRATFEVRLGPGGKVLSSRLVSASAGNEASWNAAAQSVAASLAGKQLDLGGAAVSGATIRVSTTVRHVFPAGTSKAADVKPVCANQIINDIADGASRTPAKDTEGGVPLFTDEHGRPCIPVGVAGISDAANLGATKQIQVLTTASVKVDGLEAMPSNIVPVSKEPIWLKPTDDAPRPVLPYKLRKRIRDREKKK
jgi:hypothetical protein